MMTTTTIKEEETQPWRRICRSSEDMETTFSASLLDYSFDLDELLIGLHEEDEMLPDLEMDTELLAEFSFCDEEESKANTNSFLETIIPNEDSKALMWADRVEKTLKKVCEEDNEGSLGEKFSTEEAMKSKEGQELDSIAIDSLMKGTEKEGNKSSLRSNKMSSKNTGNYQEAKKKAKVAWTPELHRRFVQAVEQLGVDKAVPSRILELMGIDCLTRHNIASHLQKYRSHRKHLLGKEVEAASWTQKPQIYGVAIGEVKDGGNIKSWYPPINMMGFPPIRSMHHPFRPLHVWGHPTMDLQSRLPLWPKQVSPTPSSLPPAWTPSPTNLSLWHSSHHRSTAPVVAVPSIPPQAMGRPHNGGEVAPRPAFDAHPSKESIDAAIGDVLARPWLPLPIGLKPPSINSVLGELQRQGVPKIPPSSA